MKDFKDAALTVRAWTRDEREVSTLELLSAAATIGMTVVLPEEGGLLSPGRAVGGILEAGTAVATASQTVAVEVKAVANARKALAEAIAVLRDAVQEAGQSPRTMNPKLLGPETERGASLSLRELKDLVSQRMRDLARAKKENPVLGAQPPPRGWPAWWW